MADLERKSGRFRAATGRDGEDLRIVLDLQQQLRPRSFLLPSGAGKKERSSRG